VSLAGAAGVSTTAGVTDDCEVRVRRRPRLRSRPRDSHLCRIPDRYHSLDADRCARRRCHGVIVRCYAHRVWGRPSLVFAAALFGCSNEAVPRTYQATGIPNQCDGGCASNEVCMLSINQAGNYCEQIPPYSPQVCAVDSGQICMCVNGAYCQSVPQCNPLDCDCVMRATCIDEECGTEPMCYGNGECGLVDGGVLQIICN